MAELRDQFVDKFVLSYVDGSIRYMATVDRISINRQNNHRVVHFINGMSSVIQQPTTHHMIIDNYEDMPVNIKLEWLMANNRYFDIYMMDEIKEQPVAQFCKVDSVERIQLEQTVCKWNCIALRVYDFKVPIHIEEFEGFAVEL